MEHPTHIITDNSDGRQRTLTGLDTTHHTYATNCNPKKEETSTITPEIIDDDQEQSHPSTRRNINDCNDYKNGKPSPSPIVGSFTENTNLDQLDYRLSIDCAMAIGASITSSGEPSYPPETTSLCIRQCHSLTGSDTVSHFFRILKTCVFQRLLTDTAAAHPIEKLGESATVSEDVSYQVMSFIQKYVYRGKTNGELVETRMRQYNKIKTKTTQAILPDPHSLKEHIKRANLQAYYWQHYLEHNITKEDPCRAGWLRDETNGLKPFWYECSRLPASIKGKRKSQAKGKEVDLVKQSKTIDEIPQQLE